MTLQESFEYILEHYPIEKNLEFRKNVIANFIRIDTKKTVTNILNSDPRYVLKGSAGQGVWAECPWIGIFDRFVTESARHGYYIVYLFKEDYSGLYLSLNQGVTTVKEKYRSNSKKALAVKANDFLTQLGDKALGLICGPIDLAVKNKSRLGSDYEVGSICSIYYSKNEIPVEDKLIQDLERFLNLYRYLIDNNTYNEEDNSTQFENIIYQEDTNLTKLHNTIERNKKLVKAVKKFHGYECQACEFNFEKTYGNVGASYIEAHHLTPLSSLKGQVLQLSPKKDFAVLCSNCHRMIHKTEYISDIAGFRQNILLKK